MRLSVAGQRMSLDGVPQIGAHFVLAFLQGTAPTPCLGGAEASWIPGRHVAWRSRRSTSTPRSTTTLLRACGPDMDPARLIGSESDWIILHVDFGNLIMMMDLVMPKQTSI